MMKQDSLYEQDKKTHVIAFLLHQREEKFAQDPFYPAILHGLEQEATDAGYHVVIHATTLQEELAITQLPLLSEQLADAYAIVGSDIDQHMVRDLWGLNVPFVLVDNHIADITVDSIEANNITGAYLATQHLLKHHQYREVAMIHGRLTWASLRDRFIGHQQAMWEAGLKAHALEMEVTTVESGAEGMQLLLAQGQPPRAIIASNDVMALGIIRAAQAAGLRVPEDVAVIGYDDIPQAVLANPPLTTVRIHTEQIGREAALRLLRLLQTERDEALAPTPTRILVHNELIVRRPCGCTD